MKLFSSLLNRDYPLSQKPRRHLLLALLFGVWIFLFLGVSDAFELYQLSYLEKFKRLLWYTFVSVLSYVLSLGYQVYHIQKAKPWTVANEVVLILINVALSAILVYAVFVTFGNENLETLYFSNYLKFVYLPSLLIILPFLCVGRFLLSNSSTSKKTEKSKIRIKGSTTRDEIQLYLEELVYLSASGNYVEVFYKNGSILEKKILRGKLLDIENQVPQLYRTHRSYLINPLFFRGFVKEKTNLFVDLGFDTKVPVSRSLKIRVQGDLPFKTKT